MVDVVKFKAARTAAGKSVLPGPGQVIIFPGVRIQRREFSLADRLKSMPNEKPANRRANTKSDD